MKKRAFRKPAKARTESELEAEFLRLFRSQLPPTFRPTLQHYFHSVRQWRFDFSWPPYLVAVEVQGHDNHYTRPGAANDYAKHNAAITLGWRILYLIDTDLEKPETLIQLCTLLGIPYEHRTTQNWTDTLNAERRNIYQNPNT